MHLRRALLSVDDCSKLEELARVLRDHAKMELLATEGTARFLRRQGIEVIDLGAYPTTPRIGRLSTLHGAVHGGLLASEDPLELERLAQIGGGPIDLVVVGLPPLFPQPARQLNLDRILANVDVGGTALLRSAMVNYERVVVIADPDDYGDVIEAVITLGDVEPKLRRRLAIKAAGILARYDAALGREVTSFDDDGLRRALPEIYSFAYEELMPLRAGTNEHQVASLYGSDDAPAGSLPKSLFYGRGAAELPTLRQARDALLGAELVAELSQPAVTIIARQTPVATASAHDLERAFAVIAPHLDRGLSEVAVAFNVRVSRVVGEHLSRSKIDVVIAPSFDPDGLAPMKARSDLCILATEDVLSPRRADVEVLPIPFAFVLETRDSAADGQVEAGDVVGPRQPLPHETDALSLAWTVAKWTRSDAVVVAKRNEAGTVRTIGVGASGVSRAHALDTALAQAGSAAAGAVLASDGPLHEPQLFDALMQCGIVAVAHPGSSQDAENAARGGHVLALVSTGVTHYRY